MANYSNSVDMSIFVSLKVAETSARVLKEPLQPLLIGGPGTGKTTAVSLFAELEGYELVMLRGNSTSPEVVHGFDVAPTDITSETQSTRHLRPVWFQTVLDNAAAGKKTLLFLDEISTSNEFVQSALMQLVLDHKCYEEMLPEDCLVVAAANYSNNLSNTMTLLAPMLNRLMVINIVLSQRDIPHFLSKYEGSLSGKRKVFKDELRKALVAVNNQAISEDHCTPEFISKVGEYIETAVRDEAMQLCNEKLLDLGVSELKDLYSDLEGKDKLPGFCTPRSLSMAVTMAVSSYLCFGKAGLSSDNFKNMLYGLVGMSLAYDDKKEVKKSIIVDRFFDAINEAGNDIEKMTNDRLPEYTKFFTDIANEELTVANCTLLTNKINEMLADKDISKIDRPIDPVYVDAISSKISETLKKAGKADKISSLTDIANNLAMSPETFVGRVNDWNAISRLMSVLYSTVNDSKKKYSQQTKETMANTKQTCREYFSRLKTFRKGFSKDPAIANMIPAIEMF